MPREARFIVFEGLDGAGTTTQAARLQALLTRAGVRSFQTHEPTPDPIGTFIRALLTGKERARDGSPFRPPERALALLFAADRLAHSDLIRAHLAAGETVVCDRYVFSSMAYQTLDPSIRAEWVVDINRGCAIPDITIFLAAPADVCLARVAARRDDTTIYENREHLETVARNYEALLPQYAASFGKVVRIDGTAGVDEVHARTLEALELE
ncbi:MAG TPA: dTMP kinase [Candidatus Krumholzibacteria bacterium]|nr:dTMP kinase [Candidatus Krumholzibacteria bacterium]